MRLNLYVFIIIAAFLYVPGAGLTVFAQTEGKIIKRVGIQGNKRVDKKSILFYIKSKRGDKFSSSTVNDDVKAIYSLGQFENIKVDAQESGDGIKLIYIVQEIPSIREFSFSGNKKISSKELKMQLSRIIKKGALYDKNIIKKAEMKIHALYEKKGFFLAVVRAVTKNVSKDQKDLIFRILEKKKVDIKKIDFTGNKAFSDKKLRKQLTIKEKGIFSFFTDSGIYQKDMIKTDMLRLELFYRENGYINVKVLDPIIDINKKEKAIFITIIVEEGKQYKTGKISFKGDDTFSEKELREKIDLKEGDTYNLTKIRKGIFDITDLYSQKGHAYADIRPDIKINANEKKVDVVMEINKGRKVYIGKISISGNEKTKDKVIRREFRFNEGDIFDSAKLKRSKERITNTKFFEEVQVQTRRGEKEDTIDIATSVIERPTGSIGAGLGYSSVDKALISGQVSQDNLFGNGQKIAFSAEFSSIRTDFNLNFTEPRLFDKEISAGIDLFNLSKDFASFTSERQGGGVRLGKSLTEYTWGKIGYRYENVKISDVEPDNVTNFLKNEERFTSRISPSIVHNTIDNALNPTRGSRDVIRAQYGGGFLGGLNFYKLIAEKKYFHPLFFGLVGMVRGKIAYAQSYGGDSLPIYERFFMGQFDLRGFTFEDVGPKDSNGDPLGGDKMLLFNAEMQYPFSNKIRGILFYDRGNVYGTGKDLSLTEENFSLSNMRHSVGLAIQFYSPIGPIGLAYGYKLDKAEGESPTEFHFILGRTF